MRLEVGTVDHERAGGGAFASQGLEDVIEDPGFAPTHEAVVEGLVGTSDKLRCSRRGRRATSARFG